MSREVVGVCALAAGLVAVALSAPGLMRDTLRLFTEILGGAGHITMTEAMADAGMVALVWALPVGAAVAVAALAAGLAQTSGRVSLKALQPQFSRLDPRKGLRRLAGAEALREAGKLVLRAGALGWAAWRAFDGGWAAIRAALLHPPGLLAQAAGAAMLHVALPVLGAYALLACVDLFLVRRKFLADSRMTKEEVREEHRDTEGDPQIKGRLRRMRLARSRGRMLKAVETATVVVTNPTHYAVALRYARGGSAAPRIVAKGVDEVAERIRDAARRHGVPLVPNPPLARALHRLPLDTDIPAEHFQAVAAIIAYVWRLRPSNAARE